MLRHSAPAWRRPLAAAVITAIVCWLYPAAAGAQPPPNDDCATPTPISGTGNFVFDNSHATTGPQGQSHQGCSPAGVPPGIANDVWFCWTPTCSGLATISTCGLTQVDTKIAIYRGCGCPVEPSVSCCNDDANSPTCIRQTTVQCDVVCGQPMMIQIGNKPGTAGGTGSFTIDCAGNPCATCPPTDGCCGGKPRFTDPAYAPFTGTVALATYEPQFPGDPFVLTIFNLRQYQTNQPYAAPIDAAGSFPTGGPNWPGYSAVYHPPSATPANMGAVFGLTLDDQGNVYVAQTSSYNFDGIGSLAGGNHGTIYQIDGVTGTAYAFISLPNTNATGTNDDWPELGNICWDCGHSQMFASDMDDGRIYRIQRNATHTGTVLSTFKHATGAISPGGAPDSTDTPGFAPLGGRVWGVQVHGGRLYYGVWSEDARSSGNVGANTVWSIALSGTGDFTGTAQLEVTLPPVPGHNNSMPASDISFSSGGNMLVGERGMASDTSYTPHQAEALEYVCNNGAWALSTNGFVVGIQYSSAGGVDYDWAPGGRVWFSGDALSLSGVPCPPGYNVYGIQGTPVTGGDPSNSIILDDDQDTCNQDKTEIGDVEIPCTTCMTVQDGQILCAPNADGSTSYTYTFTVTNTSAATASYVLLAPQGSVTFTPNIIPLSPPLAAGQSQSVTTTISGVPCAGGAGCDICFTVFLVDQNISTCCSIDHCISPPDCGCAQITHETIACIPGGGYTYTFDIQNLTHGPVEHMFLFAPTGVSATPTYFPLSPPLAPMGISTNHSVTITGATPGSTICIRISIHNHEMQECCSFVHCITLPSSCGGTPILTPPTILQQPAPLGVTAGTASVFTVAVTGTPPFTYQWRKNALDLVDDDYITGATTSTITIYPTNLVHAGYYDVVITSACCGSVVSQPAYLDVFCAVDLDHNHQIQPADIALFVTMWYTSINNGTLDADFDGNGAVQPADIAVFVNAWFNALSTGGC